MRGELSEVRGIAAEKWTGCSIIFVFEVVFSDQRFFSECAPGGKVLGGGGVSAMAARDTGFLRVWRRDFPPNLFNLVLPPALVFFVFCFIFFFWWFRFVFFVLFCFVFACSVALHT